LQILLGLVSVFAEFDGRLVTVLFDLLASLMKILTQFSFGFLHVPFGLIVVSLRATRQIR
jgi:hypothetical protein